MAEKLTYNRVNWEDLPSENTPINSENLNKMDAAIESVVSLVNQHSEKIENLEKNGFGGSGVTTAMSESLWAIMQKTAFTEALTEAELTAFKTAWGIETGEEEEPDEPEVTLTSISASYTGGEVAVGTELSALTGITVTATYSDGSTATVTDYTLSGTIAEGSNAITVSYGGKTTTFTVTGVAESGGEEENPVEPVYTLASAVTFDGTSAVAPVDTGYKLHDKDKDWTIVCDFSGNPQYQVPVWNAVDADVGIGAALYSKSGWTWFVWLTGGAYSDNGINVGTGNVTNKKVVVTHSKGDNNLTVYYVSDSIMASGEAGSKYSLTIGSPATVEIGGESDSTDKYFNGTVHDLKIYERVLTEAEIKAYLGVA